MIESKTPDTWVDLQNKISRIFSECGIKSKTPKIIDTVRGGVEVDVYAVDNSSIPETVYLCECKYWKRSIPQTVIHSFRTVVSDYGANWGLIISMNGFQSGSYDAIRKTNIKILNWIEFQELFKNRWYKNFFQKELSKVAEPLLDYTEPMNTRVFRKAALLNQNAQNEFVHLREVYGNIAFYALSLYAPWNSSEPIELPINADHLKPLEKQGLPVELFEATAYRSLLEIFVKNIKTGLEQFDNIFGCRA